MPLHDVSAFGQGRPLAGLVDGGTVFLQSREADADAIWLSIPSDGAAEILAPRNPRRRARHRRARPRHAPRPDLVLRMQGIALVGAFLRVAPFARDEGLSRDQLLAAVASDSPGSSASAARPYWTQTSH